MGLDEFVEKIKHGAKIGKYVIKAKRIEQGRFVEEFNLSISLFHRESSEHLMYVKVFLGRKPYYWPWIELFSINNELVLGDKRLNFFDSELEDSFLKFVSSFLPAGSHIFIEYIEDEETMRELTKGVPPPLTRLGFKLLNLGFTWFKDWYFPEGQNEGSPKLQAEKALNEVIKKKQLENIKEEVENWLSRNIDHKRFLKPVKRAEVVLRKSI